MNNNETRHVMTDLTNTLLDEVELIDQMIEQAPLDTGLLKLRVTAMTVILTALKGCVEEIK